MRSLERSGRLPAFDKLLRVATYTSSRNKKPTAPVACRARSNMEVNETPGVKSDCLTSLSWRARHSRFRQLTDLPVLFPKRSAATEDVGKNETEGPGGVSSTTDRNSAYINYSITFYYIILI